MRVLLFIAVLGCSWATHWMHTQLQDLRKAGPSGSELLYLPTPERLHLVSLGYREALADLIWIRAVVFAGSREQAARLSWLRRYLAAISHLSPRFARPYHWGGVVSIYSGKAVDEEMVRSAIDLYEAGIAQFPEDHEMLFALGMLLTRDVQSTSGFSGDEREAARTRGRALIRRAAAFGAPPIVRQLAASLVDEDGTDQLAAQFLETQLLQADDPGLRRLLRKKLAALTSDDHVESLNKLRTEFAAEHKETYPYLTREVYALIRHEPEKVLSISGDEHKAGSDDP